MPIGSKNTSKVIDLIEEYIEPNTHLLGMKRIHRNLFGEDISFHRWSDVKSEYASREWTDEDVRDLALRSKEIIEKGSGDISEAYFKIPNEPDTIEFVDALSSSEYSFGQHERGEGFEFGEGQGVINARYIYKDVDTNVSARGDIEKVVSEREIPFRFRPNGSLLIVESVSITSIQKIKGAITSLTPFELAVFSPPMESMGQDALEELWRIIRTDAHFENVEIIEVNNLRLANHSIESEFQEVSFTGSDIDPSNHGIQDRLQDHWKLKHLSIRVAYEDELYNIDISFSEMMPYIKISDIIDFDAGKVLMDKFRGGYITLVERLTGNS